VKTIVFAATKGGTGKTTLAFNVGMEATKHGTVYFADLDPQRSLTGLCETRGEAGDNPALLEDVQNLAEAKAALKRGKLERDYFVVDCPGSFVNLISSAVGAADCVVLPVQASILDIVAQEEIARMAREAGRADRCVFVLNRCDGRANLDDAMERLGLFPNPIVKISQRQDYARSLIIGKTGPEINKAAGEEIAALWEAIRAILRRSQ
jgi:chromosome partitioning protein